MMDIKTILIGFFLALGLSALLVPVVKKIGFKYNIYAQENNRTVHHGKIVRIGGVALFISLMLTVHIIFGLDNEYTAIVAGASIIFIGGLLDDVFDIKPIFKLLFQFAASILVVAIYNDAFQYIKFGTLVIELGPISKIIAVIWLVGITNAMNLIDGLDGLCLGVSSIMLGAMTILAFLMGEEGIAVFEIIMIGSLLGVLIYNFHPASIFIGDCGSQVIGFIIACLSLKGFKSTAVITLTTPIIILFIPIADTFSAMLRRKLKHESISQADKSHLHHVLMYRLGFTHTQTVLIIYGFTSLFAIDAVLMYTNHIVGIIVFFILVFLSYLFIELTGIVSPDYHPLVHLCRMITGHPRKSDDAYFEANKINHKKL